MKREKITFTMTNSLIKKFKELTNKKFINKSALVENLIDTWIKNTENNNEKDLSKL